MATASIVSPIPKLREGQKVREWRKLYLAATSLITERQKIELLPAYGARDEGELLIAEVCAKKTTITEALNELEAPTTLKKFNKGLALFKKVFDIKIIIIPGDRAWSHEYSDIILF